MYIIIKRKKVLENKCILFKIKYLVLIVIFLLTVKVLIGSILHSIWH